MIRAFRGRRPAVAESAYIDPSAQVIGDVTIGERVSVWPNVSIRGDVNRIQIGDDSNVQDCSALHVDDDQPLTIGSGVVIGHAAIVHGCTVEDDCLIAMGSTILNGARIGRGSIVAAGALVVEGADIPPGSVVMGVPGKVRRQTTEEDLEAIRENAQSYVRLSREYLEES